MKSPISKAIKKKSKEQNEKDYHDRSRSWDVKNKYYGSGVGGNTI